MRTSPSRSSTGRSTVGRSSSRHARSRRRKQSSAARFAGRVVDLVASPSEDTWGWLFVLVGVLAALGIHFNVLGPAGHVLKEAMTKAFGWGAVVAPAALVVGGVILLAGRASRGVLGVLAAFGLLLVASAGLADLAAGSPGVHSTWLVLGGAGGIVGAAVGGGIAKVIGVAGASVLLGAVAIASVSGLVGMPLMVLVTAGGRVIAAAARAVAAVFGGWIASMRLAPAPHLPSGDLAPGAGGDAGGFGVWSGAASAVAPGAGHVSLLAANGPAADLDPATADGADGASTIGGLRGEPDVGAVAVHGTADAGEGALSAGFGDRSDGGKAEQLSLPVEPTGGTWKLPSLKLLKRSKEQDLDRKAIEESGRVLERALAAHGVETHLVGFTVGPTVTRFELELGAGVKVARVTTLAKDIAYAMASPDVRILAPIPGRSAIGVEVPNRDRQLVTVGDVLTSLEARRATHPLEVALGRDIAGRSVIVNLAEMPHLLIAGATGAGKSSCINSLVTSVLMRATPDDVRLILVDPKRVELGHYNGLPHLLTQVVVNPKRAANALAWAVTEMERRYDLLAECGMRDITGYNTAVDRGELDDEAGIVEAADAAADAYAVDDVDALEAAADGADHDGVAVDAPHEQDAAVAISPASPHGLAVRVSSESQRHGRLPYILIVVDELNDLMMVAARDVEESICRIAQMARAVGIHLVIATQRPSVDVITGVIKANIPSRLAFSVSSLADSRVILDQPGAERLVGRGDLLLLTASSSIPRRIQGPWVGEDEVRAVVGQWRRQSGPRYVEGVEGDASVGPGGGSGIEDEDDELSTQAMELVVRSQLGSTSMLQRKLRVGFARAGRLMDLLERRGVVGPSEGSKARAVLMTAEELDQQQH